MDAKIDIQKNIADYVAWMGIKNVRISEKTGLSAQKVGQQLLCKQKMTCEDIEKYCRAVEQGPNFFVRDTSNEAWHGYSDKITPESKVV